jgi:hypothetical protein
MRHLTIPVLAAFTLIAPTAQSQLKGDPSRGAEHYRACVACHSLVIGSHLSGPSLADLWGGQAGHRRRRHGGRPSLGRVLEPARNGSFPGGTLLIWACS